MIESGQTDVAEKTLRAVLQFYSEQSDKDLIDDYFPAQAQFFHDRKRHLRVISPMPGCSG